MIKKVCAVLLALMILFTVPTTAYAHDVPQDRDDCSIEVLVRFSGEDVSGGTLTAIKVGYVDEEDGNFFFSQELTGLRIEDITSADAAGAQRDFYEANRAQFDFVTQTQSVRSGRAVFEGLSTGLYLVVQNEAADGFSKMKPFLVSVPYLDNGVYQYHITASIKSELKREPDPTDPPPSEPSPTDPPPTEPDGPDIPQTGQLNWPIPLMATAGLACFATGWMLCFGKKRERKKQ